MGRNRANGVKRVAYSAAMNALRTHHVDFVLAYVQDLRHVVDMEAIRAAGLRMGVDPLGGAAERYWEPINFIYGLAASIVNLRSIRRFHS
jgi:phosphoglucomutase